MQNAKDSFYEVLRERLATVNPERTVAVRGVTRPALVVDENELPGTGLLPDCFHLQWTGASIDVDGALPCVTLQGLLRYSTSGSAWNGGLDRGRMLAAMDGEALALVNAGPQSIAKRDYSALGTGGQPSEMGSCIWWSDLVFESVAVKGSLLERQARVQVMCFQEAGEL